MHTLLSSRSHLDLNYRENGKMILKVRKKFKYETWIWLVYGISKLNVWL